MFSPGEFISNVVEPSRRRANSPLTSDSRWISENLEPLSYLQASKAGQSEMLAEELDNEKVCINSAGSR